MKISSSLLFAKSLIFPRSLKKSAARRSIIGAIACIAISIVPMIVVVSVVNGMISGMTERIIALSSNHLQAYIRRASPHAKSLDSLLELAEEFTEVEGVEQIYPQIECNALASYEGFRTGAKIRAMQADVFEKNPDYKKLFKLCGGSYSDFQDGKRNAVIGEHLAELLKIQVGESFSLVTTKKSPSGTIIPKVSVFKVAAIISSGYQELDALWVFIPLDVAFKTLPLESCMVSVQMTTPDAFSSELWKIKQEANKVCYGRATVFSWDELNASQFQNFSSTKIMIDFVMMLIVLVALVNISSALIMLVMERRKEIAILKSLGSSKDGIGFAFLIAGTFCAVTGLIIALPVGILLSVNANGIVRVTERIINIFANVTLMDPAYYLQEIPVVIPWGEIGLICVGVFILSILVSIVPAVKAGKENPLDTFRKA